MPVGHTNNPHGRPAGTPNKLTSELRTALKNILADEITGLPELLDGMPPRDKIELLIRLMSFVLPKVQPVCSSSGEPFKMTDPFA